MDLLFANIELIKSKELDVQSIFQNAIKEIKANYNLIIIDSPPDVNFAVLNTLVATDEVISVVTPDGFSQQGLENMEMQLENIQKFAPNILFKGCVLNKYINTQNTETCLSSLKEISPAFKQTLRFTRDRIDAANYNRKLIFQISPGCGFVQDLKKIVAEILK